MRGVAALVFALALVWAEPLAVVSAEQPPAARSPRNASYRLDATLDVNARRLTGSGTLTWRNITSNPATELRFHLYWNAWRDDDSSWMREQGFGRNGSLLRRPESDRAAIDLSSLIVKRPSGTEDVLARATFVAPDDGNSNDRTVLAVPLSRPVAPGETIDIDLAWQSRIPRTFARTGVLDRYYFIAHWFPKIGVFEDAGWNAHQFHAATEFFSDFGVYDVRLTVPAGWPVGATGRATGQQEHGDTTTHRFVAEDVHDFAWTTSPDFIESTERFTEPGLPPVDMRLLLQPEHRGQESRHFNSARVALKLFGTWAGAYPYPQLTIVDPVTIVNADSQGESTDGMEYPTLISAGTYWLAPWRGDDPEQVMIHEVGHQFFHTVVATNEFEHAWMDEGITTYLTAKATDEAMRGRFVMVGRYFGGLVVWPYADAPWVREVHGNRLAAYRASPNRDVPASPTWRYWPGTASTTTYAATSVWLETLERLLGWETMRNALATYYSRGAFRHPTPDEFMTTVSTVSGRDLGWFFDAVYRSSATFDYSVGEVLNRDTGNGPEATVVVRRLADGVFPVDVRVDFADGTHAVERWDGRDPWRTFTYGGRRITRVYVDPDRVLQLDLNETNNSWVAQPRRAEAARKWATHWLLWLEHTLMTYAFFV